jgi:predicted nucleotidyltransferase
MVSPIGLRYGGGRLYAAIGQEHLLHFYVPPQLGKGAKSANVPYLSTSKNHTAMDKGSVNLDRATVDSVIVYLHQTLAKHGLGDSHIALFGSFFNGNTHEDSDIDLIIISKSFEGKNIFERIDMIVKPEIEVMRKYQVPIDILLKTPEEYEYSKRTFFNSKVII